MKSQMCVTCPFKLFAECQCLLFFGGFLIPYCPHLPPFLCNFEWSIIQKSFRSSERFSITFLNKMLTVYRGKVDSQRKLAGDGESDKLRMDFCQPHLF